jgi:ABC-type Fe3+/spermidine/putrescine transport system ATPase subunit
MSEGRFVELGSPDELYYRPRAAFTARLIGGANILDGVAAQADDGLTAVETPLGRLVSRDRAQGAVQVFVRPDKIVPAAGPALNLLECRVRERRFAGEMTELDLACGDSGQVLRWRVATTFAPALGQNVQVRVEPADVRIFSRHSP